MSAANLSFAPASAITAGNVTVGGQLNLQVAPTALADSAFQLVNGAGDTLWDFSCIGAQAGDVGADLMIDSGIIGRRVPLVRATRAGVWNHFGVVSMAGNDLTGLETLSGGSNRGVTLNATIGPVSILQQAARQGSVTANAATPVNVAVPSCSANTVVILCCQTAVGTPNAYVSAVTPTVGFNITSIVGDTSMYRYTCIETA